MTQYHDDDYEDDFEMADEDDMKLYFDLTNLRFASIRDMIAQDKCLPTACGMTKEQYTKQCKQELAKHDDLLQKLGKDKLYIEDADRISEILKGEVNAKV